eukprot:GHVR01099172.1.p1 GENE.GHVR01099172.1~~GHVR01099172.1.p1  ORF type:complete len:124 (+),score=6.75 GHVR01099172.1:64-435(+)
MAKRISKADSKLKYLYMNRIFYIIIFIICLTLFEVVSGLLLFLIIILIILFLQAITSTFKFNFMYRLKYQPIPLVSQIRNIKGSKDFRSRGPKRPGTNRKKHIQASNDVYIYIIIIYIMFIYI